MEEIIYVILTCYFPPKYEIPPFVYRRINRQSFTCLHNARAPSEPCIGSSCFLHPVRLYKRFRSTIVACQDHSSTVNGDLASISTKKIY